MVTLRTPAQPQGHGATKYVYTICLTAIVGVHAHDELQEKVYEN